MSKRKLRAILIQANSWGLNNAGVGNSKFDAWLEVALKEID
jgi:hypothetical protein